MGDKKEILESRDRVICNLVVETPKTRWTIGGRGRGRSGGCDAPKAHLQITKDGGESRAVAMDGIPGDLGRGDEIKPPSQKPWFRRGRGIYYPRELGRGRKTTKRIALNC